ncbi:MAG: trigger factor [Bacilli bacterium]|nr:trigger factor [Bacilli bacterium]
MKKTYLEKLEGKAWQECLDKAFDKKKKDLKVDGFRKGQCPKEVYIKKFGIESLYMDAVDVALQKVYESLISKEDTIKPACAPAVDIKNITPEMIEVEMTFVSEPEVKLGKYTGLKIKKEEIKVTDEEVEHELYHIQNDFAEIKIVEDGELKEGQIAIIDFEGFKDGKAFDGGKSEGYSLTIGSHTFIPGFEEKLIGMKKGEERDIELTFPEDYHAEELKGKDVVFKVKLHEIKERLLPEMDENFFKDLGMEGVDSKEKLVEEVKGNIKAGKERQLEEAHIFKCLDKVVENAKFEIPSELTEDEVNRLLEEFNMQLGYQGLNLDKYLEMTNSKIEDLRKQMEGEANKRIGYRLVINAIIKEENLTVEDKDADKIIEDMMKQYNATKEELLKNIGGIEVVKHDLLVKKVFELISK